MKKLYKGIFRELIQKKWQYGGTMLLIMIAVLMYVMLSASITAVDQSNQRFKRDYKQEDFHFYVSSQLDSEAIKQIEKNNGVVIEKRITADVDLSAKKSLRFFNLPHSVNQAFLSEGRLPDENHEFAISEAFAKANNIKVGDMIKLNGTDWKISGLAYLPDYIYSVKNEEDLIHDSSAFGIALTSEKNIDALGPQTFYYVGRWNEHKHDLSKLKSSISKVSPVIRWVNAKENSRISYINTEIKGTRSFTTALPLFIAIIAMMMVIILVRRRLQTQRKQIGTQLALGYRPSELIKAYILYPVIVSLSGSFLGIISGLLLSLPLTDYYTFFYNLPLLSRWGMSPFVILGAVFVPLILLVSAGYWAIRKQVSLSPIELLRPASTDKKGRKPRKSIPIVKGFKMRFRLRMLTKNIGRIVYLLIGICFATILLMYGFISMNSMDVLMNKTYQEGMNYNYGIYYQELKQGKLQGEADVFSIAEADVKSKNAAEPKKIQLYGIDQGIHSLNLKNKDGKDLSSSMDGGIILNKVVAYSLNVKKGDQVTIKMLSNDKKKSFRVKGIAELYTGTSAYIDRKELNQLAEYPENAYLGKWTMQKPKKEKSVLMVENKQDMMDSMESLMGPMRYSIFIMAFLAFLIGLIIITLITNLIVDENTAAISLMKVIGYEDSTISKLMLNIYTPIVFLAYVIGVPSAIYSIDALMKSIASQTNYVLPVSVDPIMFAVGLLLILACYYVSIWIAKRKLKKVSLQEVLKRQEG
ncbi:ABC transporter permease [Falsibacillus albus]|nr:FtsX-like permease family protein [Falsibacillus albus]